MDDMAQNIYVTEFSAGHSDDVVAPSRTPKGRMQKLFFDYLIAVPCLVIFSIPMIVIALLIVIESPGSPFFRQPRIGFNGRRFYIWKFRTMFSDETDISGSILTVQDDQRITPLGAILRKTSVDEIPQIINVLFRQMSVVGPRPHALAAKAAGKLYSDAVSNYDQRHCVLPGITGWAQVNGFRGETATTHQIEQRVEHDMSYIVRWTVWMDVKIVLMTLREPLRANVW